MSTNVHPGAGTPAPADELVNVARLVTAYYAVRPDPLEPSHRVSFGTSGHRGSALRASFNEPHILAITQAICELRAGRGVDGPLFLGMDTHALSEPAFASALEVLAANGVNVRVDSRDGFTPTPVISHAILSHNRNRESGYADGIVITPSHNPPEDGGFKYNPPNGGPADTGTTGGIAERANAILEAAGEGVNRIPFERARRAPTTHAFDYIDAYVSDLGQVIDLETIRASGLRLGADPLGGSGMAYWTPIAERYGLALEVVDPVLDGRFAFMPRDHDGRIRMDCSSRWAMQRLIGLSDRFDVAFGNDTDFDRHGIVVRGEGLIPPNQYLAAAIDYLFRNRPDWPPGAAIGKTVVSSSIIDRVAERLGRPLFEVPVGFKWFVDGLLRGSCAFGGEESAGATLVRRDGSVWTTDKDGIVMGLLAAEITARSGCNPAEMYADITRELGAPLYERIDTPATSAEKDALKRLSGETLSIRELGGDPVEAVLDRAPGNGSPIGGIKVVTRNGWFAARPSGTEDVYKLYAESFVDEEHLRRIQEEAREVIRTAIADGGSRSAD